MRVSYNGWSMLKNWQIKSNQDWGEGTPGPRSLSCTLASKSVVRDWSGSLTTRGWETSSTTVLLSRLLGAYWFQKLFALYTICIALNQHEQWRPLIHHYKSNAHSHLHRLPILTSTHAPIHLWQSPWRLKQGNIDSLRPRVGRGLGRIIYSLAVIDNQIWVGLISNCRIWCICLWSLFVIVLESCKPANKFPSVLRTLVWE